MSYSIHRMLIKGGASIGAGYAVGALAEHVSPPTGTRYRVGETYFERGHKKIVIGYSGHHKDMKLNPNMPLYFGSKETAQRYSQRYGNDGVVFLVIANEPLRYRDYGRPRTATNLFPYGHFKPISPSGLQQRQVALVEPEAVTPLTKVGKLAAIRRILS
jgi:hypothetical protein